TQPAFGQRAARVDRRLELAVGPQGGEGRGTRIQLRRGRGEEELVRLMFVDGVACLGIDYQDAPTALAVGWRVDDRLDLDRQVVGGVRGTAGQWRGQETQKDQHTRTQAPHELLHWVFVYLRYLSRKSAIFG